MAIDTAARRFSMLGFGNSMPLSVLVPDGTIGASDRADLLYCYSGLDITRVPTVPGAEWTMPTSRAHYTVPDALAHFTIGAALAHYALSEDRAHYTLEIEKLHFTPQDEDT